MRRQAIATPVNPDAASRTRSPGANTNRRWLVCDTRIPPARPRRTLTLGLPVSLTNRVPKLVFRGAH